jgi:tricarballylate dehydrogenase
VLGKDGPLPGLYAAGEITGHFWGTAPNAVSVLRALVFGRIAGREAISHFESAREVLPAGAEAAASTRRR